MNFTPVYPKPKKKPDLLLWFMIAVCVALFALIFTGCATPQQLIDKANAKDPAAVAAYTRDKYPCTELLKTDTAVIYQDSLIYIDCPDNPPPTTYETVRTDTINNVITRIVRVPVHLPVQTQIVTRWFEDSAKLKLLALQVQELQDKNDALTKDLSDMTGNRNWYRRYFFYELGLLIILLLLAIWKIYKRATTLKLS